MKYTELVAIGTELGLNITDHDVKSRIAYYNKTTNNNPDTLLELRWYSSLQSSINNPDYGIYSAPEYIPHAIACYDVYSRQTVKALHKYFSSMNVQPKSIVDLGCGIGASTADLKAIYPAARVIGTNVEGSPQFRFCAEMADRYSFEIEENLAGLPQADIVLASEYFEHFQEPLDHLQYVVSTLKPNYLVIANAFGASAAGHFPEYKVQLANKLSVSVANTSISRLFNAELKRLGYTRQVTGLWNNRPAIWRRNTTDAK